MGKKKEVQSRQKNGGKKKSFEVTDVRELTGNLLPMLLKKAGKVTVGDGWHVSSA